MRLHARAGAIFAALAGLGAPWGCGGETAASPAPADGGPTDARATSSSSGGGSGSSGGSTGSSSGSAASSSGSSSGGPMQTCPTPQAVVPGDSCDVEPTLECPDDQVVRACDGGVLLAGSCNCQGNIWACSIDAGIPPDYPDSGFVPGCPHKTWAIPTCATCDLPGMFCPFPRSCAGSMVTHTLECINGIWQDVAPGVCDAGSPDAGFD